MSWRAQLSKNLVELRVMFDPKSSGSVGAKEFVQNNYKELKRLNPKFPILIRPFEKITSRFIAVYDYGEYVQKDLEGLSEEEVVKQLEEIVIIGTSRPKADVAPFQFRYKNDVDCVKYEDLFDEPYQFRIE